MYIGNDCKGTILLFSDLLSQIVSVKTHIMIFHQYNLHRVYSICSHFTAAVSVCFCVFENSKLIQKTIDFSKLSVWIRNVMKSNCIVLKNRIF